MGRGYAVIALDNPKTTVNIGSALRACDVYGAAMLVASGKRIKGTGSTNTFKTERHKPFLRVEDVFDALPHDCVPVAIELVEGAQSLCDYKHPERAFYIFGAEDATLGARVLDKCRDVVQIPTDKCMNLAATVNVVLYDRLAKQEKQGA